MAVAQGGIGAQAYTCARGRAERRACENAKLDRAQWWLCKEANRELCDTATVYQRGHTNANSPALPSLKGRGGRGRHRRRRRCWRGRARAVTIALQRLKHRLHSKR